MQKHSFQVAVIQLYERGYSNMKKATLILWIVAAVFLISSVPLFTQGNAAAGACGIVIAAILFFIGFRKKNAAPAPKQEGTPAAPAAATSAASSAPTTHTESKPAIYSQEGFDFLRTKVAGVTFKNGRKSRQTILRKIYFKDEPFDKGDMELSVQRGEWEGKPAFGVYVNGEQIGSIPAEHVPFLEERFSRFDGITNIEVYGGGDGHNYGAEVILRFRKDS